MFSTLYVCLPTRLCKKLLNRFWPILEGWVTGRERTRSILAQMRTKGHWFNIVNWAFYFFLRENAWIVINTFFIPTNVQFDFKGTVAGGMRSIEDISERDWVLGLLVTFPCWLQMTLSDFLVKPTLINILDHLLDNGVCVKWCLCIVFSSSFIIRAINVDDDSISLFFLDIWHKKIRTSHYLVLPSTKHQSERAIATGKREWILYLSHTRWSQQ